MCLLLSSKLLLERELLELVQGDSSLGDLVSVARKKALAASFSLEKTLPGLVEEEGQEIQIF